jgi:CspA family cold shock protein
MTQNGTIKFFNRKRGFGFIENRTGEDFYVRISSISQDISSKLSEGAPVTFDVKEGKQGPIAVNVKIDDNL